MPHKAPPCLEFSRVNGDKIQPALHLSHMIPNMEFQQEMVEGIGRGIKIQDVVGKFHVDGRIHDATANLVIR